MPAPNSQHPQPDDASSRWIPPEPPFPLSQQSVLLPISCLCGEIQGYVSGRTPVRRICHCRVCKKVTGGTHGDYLVVEGKNLLVHENEKDPDFRIFVHFSAESATVPIEVFRCAKCCTPMFLRRGSEESETILVFVGCLVDHRWLDAHPPVIASHSGDKCISLSLPAESPAPLSNPKPDNNDLTLSKSIIASVENLLADNDMYI